MEILTWLFQLIRLLSGDASAFNNNSVTSTTSSSVENQTNNTQQQNYQPMKGGNIALVGDSWASGMKSFWKLGNVYAYPGRSWPDISKACAKAAADGYKFIVVWCGVNGYPHQPYWHSNGVVSCCNSAPNSNLWFFQYAKQQKVQTRTQRADPSMEQKIRTNVIPGIMDGVRRCKNARFTDLSNKQYPLNISLDRPVNGVYQHDGFHLTGAGFKQLANDIASIIKNG